MNNVYEIKNYRESEKSIQELYEELRILHEENKMLINEMGSIKNIYSDYNEACILFSNKGI